MTSPFTDEPTRKFFESHKYFGLDEDQVITLNLLCSLVFSCISFHLFLGTWNKRNCFWMQVTFFQQGTIPCVSKDGRFIMETPYSVWWFLSYHNKNVCLHLIGLELHATFPCNNILMCPLIIWKPSWRFCRHIVS